MWGKPEQAVIWTISYIPIFLIAFYRYYFEYSISEIKIFNQTLTVNAIHLISIITIVIFSFVLYFLFPKIIFRKIERAIEDNKRGMGVYIKQFEKLSINDYTFFLLTLILPIITVDFSSTVSLLLCLSIIIFIIVLLTSINYIIACPIFFISAYKVWKVSFVETSDINDQYVINAYVITSRDDFFNSKFKVVKLLSNIYFLK